MLPWSVLTVAVCILDTMFVSCCSVEAIIIKKAGDASGADSLVAPVAAGRSASATSSVLCSRMPTAASLPRR
ncbi:hypothetical protein PF005_g27263 [Phytophthora fragariae]|uniref:Secreted protein n=1 Tax=Phytophthora fragariae TaxID=53985 RepID=A0A6A4BH79_9STRA|nr:hypothetical protein PF009_g24331 [Phytophthora fragariae]KAE8970069.1 hypothetical protein PF011_g26557 [Phytophthora fragariae]KAE9068200.1 hypothetical protein PF010_g27153 [Phytophthora fragariae]KAE9080833.1 hypothetical protein PF007_g22884 [Phytophthora fragariae]KAE9100801.1 hypothetical protein PF006_g22817 [Phytophthora fragariae]